MGQDRGLCFPTQRLSSLSTLALSHLGKQNLNLTSKTYGTTTNMFSTLRSYPVSTQFFQSHLDGSNGWVDGSSHSKKQLFSPPNPFMKKMPLHVDGVISKPKGQCSQKRLLVFDQSGDQTTLLLPCDIRKSMETLKQPACSDMKEELLRSNKDLFVYQGKPGNCESYSQEDTEELNALLYSEDESGYYSEEDEVTSSCQSPSTVASAHGDKERFVDSYRESLHANKKRKKHESSAPFLVTSSCGSCDNTGIGFMKRPKTFCNKIGEEKIFETVSLLRGIVPGEELVDPILVIDRAIDYLKSLKMEAKNQGHGPLYLHVV